MQFLKLAHELITDKNITSNEFRIYTYLMSLYNKEKKCAYPSIEVISKKVSISIRTVKSAIKRLVELGYMIIEKKKGINGNYNEYKSFKYLIKDKNSSSTYISKKVFEKETGLTAEEEIAMIEYTRKNQLEMRIPNSSEILNPYTTEDSQKISLVLKQNININRKQMDIISYMDIELLKEALKNFKKKQGKYFNFLLELYIDKSLEKGIDIDYDIQRYRKEKIFIPPSSHLEMLEVKQAMINDGIYNEDEWNKNVALGL
ncbi:MAG: helix-turn-helix domain-containing protein [Clostridium sp.]|uniref:helix-turn-helix domain-containing protein n=1 Tax=Clostridium TaxID=1485 RepID=UPI001C1DFEAE|nr:MULTISPECIES: helix-turn-helix domain-containing protein [Clostridium]MBS5926996.1 helix-turn-helix domain-containing protein [Clostridium sp.]MBU6134535.1 helix-turn-helix domain-containing protein [Clostridium tertium]